MIDEQFVENELPNPRSNENVILVRGNRQAAIIGVDIYEDKDIEKLPGARYDAKEVHDLLAKKEIGNFEIKPEHYLIGKEADCRNIRKAISDLFWRTDSGDLALLYFSGHGFRDGHGVGYIAPWDMKRNEPFVSGINMEEIKSLMMKSVSKKNVVMILDCCYGGIATQGDTTKGNESIPDIDKPFKEFEVIGEGKIIMASSGPNERSREMIENHKGENERESHPHGIFTYHLLEGLRDGASSEGGIITLAGLWDYIVKKFGNKEEQKPKIYVAEGYSWGNLKIAQSANRYNEFINIKLDEAEESYANNDLMNIIYKTTNIKSVLDLNENDKRAIEIKNKYNEKFEELKPSVLVFVKNHTKDVIANIRDYGQRTIIMDFVERLNLDEIADMESKHRDWLLYLCLVSTGNMGEKAFVLYCNQSSRPTSDPIQTQPYKI